MGMLNKFLSGGGKRRRSSRRRPPAKTKRQRKKDEKRAAAIGAVAVMFGLGVAGAVALVARGRERTDEPAEAVADVSTELFPIGAAAPDGTARLGDELTFLSENTELVIQIRLAALAKSPLSSVFLKGPDAPGLWKFVERFGARPEEIDSLTFGVASVVVDARELSRRVRAVPEGTGNSLLGVRYSPQIVVCGRRPLDIENMAWSRTEPADGPNDRTTTRVTFGGAKYYRLDGNIERPRAAIMLHPNLGIETEVQHVHDVIQGRRSTSFPEEFGISEGGHHIVVAFVPRNIERYRKIAEAAGQATPAIVRGILDYADKGARGTALTIAAGEELEVSLTVLAQDEPAAAALRAEADSLVGLLRAAAAARELTGGKPWLEPLLPLAEALRTETSDDRVRVSLRMPREAVEEFMERLPRRAPAAETDDKQPTAR